MKLFLSYGHDGNAPFVRRIRSDLEAAGHVVWLDTSEIAPGDDWRRKILDGLSGAERVLAFLSRHSVRDPGVCLDEIAIALHAKHGAISTVLIEPAEIVEPPVSVSHIQWLDMSGWAGRPEVWYEGKLAELLALLAHADGERFGAETGRLAQILPPVSQQAEIGRLVDGFVGRDWLRGQVEAWRRGAKKSRMLWITGEAGAGKSAFAAWLGHYGKIGVIGLNLCAYDDSDRRDTARVLRTLAFQIARRLPDYRRLLLEALERPDIKDELGRKSPAALFAFLIVEPLHICIDGARRDEPYVLVIDGLDETVDDNGWSELAALLAAHARKLPPWLRLVVTSRDVDSIRAQFGELEAVRLSADSPENRADLEAYARAWLSAEPRLRGGLEATVARVASASEGNFLYVSKLREAVERGEISLDAPEGLPSGLTGLYRRWFQHRFRNEPYDPYRPGVAAIVAAEGAVPEPWLRQICQWDKREAARRLAHLGGLFERRPDGVAPFHKSLRDWLLDEKAAGPNFFVEEAEGAALLAPALWAEFSRWARQTERGALDPFVIAELPAQIRRLDEAARRRLLDEQGGWSANRAPLFETAETLAASYAWRRALEWWDMSAGLADAAGEEALWHRAYALLMSGDILVTIGRGFEALARFRGAGDIFARLAEADPANAGWRRELSVSFNRIGDVLVAQGNLPEALKAFRNGLAIAEALAKADPGNAGWRRDLSVSYDRVGDVLVAEGKLSEALKAFRDGLAIAEALAKADPGNAGWRRDVSVSFNKIGDVLVAEGKLPEALNAFRDGLASKYPPAKPGALRF